MSGVLVPDEKRRRCTRCNQTWPVTEPLKTDDFCADGTIDHQFVVLCGEMSVAMGSKKSCDLHDGHGTRHTGVDEKGIRWDWDSPVMAKQHERLPPTTLLEAVQRAEVVPRGSTVLPHQMATHQSHRDYRERAAEHSLAPDRGDRHLDRTFGTPDAYRGVVPTVGRTVHYTSLGDRDGKFPSEAHAAIITKVIPKPTVGNSELKNVEDGYSVSLRIFYETGDFWMKDVPFTRGPAGHEDARAKWAWPARS